MATLLLVGLCFALTSCGECKHAELSEDYEIVDPTCTADGKYVYTCLKCNEEVEVAPEADDTTMLKTGHTADNGTVTTAPTCTADGEKTFKCKVCDAAMPELTETVAALGHDVDEEEYESDGTTHWNVCEREGCGAKVNEEACEMNFMSIDEEHCAKACFVCAYVDQSTVQEHTMDAGTVSRAPTCAKVGELTYACEDCGYETTEEIALVAHTFDTAAWETDGTNHWHACSVCGEKDETSVTACVYGTPVVVNPEAGSCKPGSSTATCNGCGGTQVSAIPSDSQHKLSGVTTDAALGITKYTCSVCASVYTITGAGQLMDFETGATSNYDANNKPYWKTELVQEEDGNTVVSCTASEKLSSATDGENYYVHGPFRRAQMDGQKKFILDFDIKTTETGLCGKFTVSPKSQTGSWPGDFLTIQADGSVIDRSSAEIAPAGTINATEWTHVSILYEAETGTITTYLNGVLCSSVVSSNHIGLTMQYVNLVIPKALTDEAVGSGVLLDNMTLATGDAASITLTVAD